MEARLNDDGRHMSDVSMDELEALWRAAKQAERGES